MLVSESDFRLMEWSRGIPLVDENLWLGMQARNIALVDMSIIRDMEQQALDAYMERERTPTDILMVLSAVSQMWVFSLYEFLRTWRQRASELIRIADECEKRPQEERPAFLRAAVEAAEKKEQLVRLAPTFYADQVRRLADPRLVEALRNYLAASEQMFRDCEALRVTLAKHEVPRTPGYMAEAPGYGRMSYLDGSMYWFLTLRDGSQIQVNRRVLANAFMDIDPELPAHDSA